MVSFTILAGGYTAFVATYVFNSESNALLLTGNSTTGDNCSWISLLRNNILYAVNEDTEGALQSFTIDDSTGLLTTVATTSSGGNGPPFTAPLIGGQVAIMNYGSGTGKIIPTTSDRLHFESAPTITFPVPAGITSLPHMAYQHGSEVLVPDKGADKIWRLGQVSSGETSPWEIHGFIIQPTGSGPRHIAIQENYLFTIHELASTLTSQVLPPAPNGTSSLISNFSIIPPDPPAGSVFAGAEIQYPVPNSAFPSRYIYVSNRNTGIQDSRGDAITIFKTTENGVLTLVRYVYTGLNQIRGMELGGPDSKYLIAGGYGGGGVAMFERIDGGANLKLLARNTDLPTRTTFVWLD